MSDGTQTFKVSLNGKGGELDSRHVLIGPGMSTSVKATVLKILEECEFLDDGDQIIVTELGAKELRREPRPRRQAHREDGGARDDGSEHHRP